ncbi:MAG TPA: peptidyl-prolyl cis-trans isomerase [Candidatus Sumerlaeota bacterium]|nr:peptidyl-prolyl cis-trans isomerase [Candidatus Sumerlaeota bacterium]
MKKQLLFWGVLCLLFASCRIEKASGPENIPAAPPAHAVPEEPLNPLVELEPAPRPPGPRDIILRVGGRDITRDDFEKRYLEYLLIADFDQEKILTRREFLDKLTRDELLREYAEQERIEKDPAFRALVERDKTRLLIEHILRTLLSSKTEVTPQDLLSYYEARKAEFTKPATIQVRHIRTLTQDEAQQALARLDNGEDFADVARDMSIHSSRDQGGLLPRFSRGTYNPEFEQAAFALKVGGRSDVVKTELGYHIIEKTSEAAESVTPFEEVREQIQARVREEKRAIALDEFYKVLREQISVTIINQP